MSKKNGPRLHAQVANPYPSLMLDLQTVELFTDLVAADWAIRREKKVAKRSFIYCKSVGLSNVFWLTVEAGKTLMLQKCKGCGAMSWPMPQSRHGLRPRSLHRQDSGVVSKNQGHGSPPVCLRMISLAEMRAVAAAETMLPATPGPSPATNRPAMAVSRFGPVSTWVAKNLISGA